MKAENDTECLSLAAWYRSHAPSLARMLCSRFVRSAKARGEAGKDLGSDDVDDLLQDVFVRLLSTGAMPRLQSGHSPLPYLARAARNLAIDELRRRRREQQALALSSASAASNSALGLAEADASEVSPQREREGHEERLERLGVYVAALPAELAAVYHARFVLGLSQRETASELALSRRRVRTLDERLLAGAASWLEPRAGSSRERPRPPRRVRAGSQLDRCGASAQGSSAASRRRRAARFRSSSPSTLRAHSRS